MLTAVIHARADATDLALTLAALVPAVAEGLMSHAVVVLDRADANLERIADAMGASIVVTQAQPWLRGAEAARGEWVLLLTAGEEPGPGWIGAVERHLMTNAVTRRRPALLPAASGLPAWAERVGLLIGDGRARAGLVAPRALVASGGPIERPARLPTCRLPARR